MMAKHPTTVIHADCNTAKDRDCYHCDSFIPEGASIVSEALDGIPGSLRWFHAVCFAEYDAGAPPTPASVPSPWSRA